MTASFARPPAQAGVKLCADDSGPRPAPGCVLFEVERIR